MTTNGDLEGRISYTTITRIMETMSCSPLHLFFFLKNKPPEVPKYAKMQFHTMTLLDVLSKIVWIR